MFAFSFFCSFLQLLLWSVFSTFSTKHFSQNNFVLEGNDFEKKSFTRGSAELQNTDWKTYGDFLWMVT